MLKIYLHYSFKSGKVGDTMFFHVHNLVKWFDYMRNDIVECRIDIRDMYDKRIEKFIYRGK